MHTIVRGGRLSGRTSAPRGRAPASFGSRVASLLRHVLAWSERVRQRRALLTLDDRMLKDIGVSRADVLRECDKPFWQE
jgi:uncharacterized protein YjiS (DUF1127 family)